MNLERPGVFETKEEKIKEVDIDIRMKAYNNAEKFYQEKKKMESKEKKTMEASNQALKLAEKAAMHEMNHVNLVAGRLVY